MVSSPSRLAVISSLLSIFMLVPPGRAADASVGRVGTVAFHNASDGKKEILYLRGCNARQIWAGALAKYSDSLASVKRIIAKDCDIGAELKSFLPMFPALVELRLRNCKISDLGPAGLLCFNPELEIFDVAGNDLELVPDHYFLDAPKLKVLDLSHNKIKSLWTLEVCADLKYFSCADNPDLNGLPHDFSLLCADVYNISRCPGILQNSLEVVGDQWAHERRWGLAVNEKFPGGRKKELNDKFPHSFVRYEKPYEADWSDGVVQGVANSVYSGWATAFGALTRVVSGARYPSATLIVAKGGVAFTPEKRLGIAGKHAKLRYAVSNDASGVPAWDVRTHSTLRNRFAKLLRDRIARALRENTVSFCPLSNGSASWSSSLTTQLAAVENVGCSSHDAVKKFLKTSHEWQVSYKGDKCVKLDDATLERYTENLRALTTLFVATERRVKAIAYYCACLAQMRGSAKRLDDQKSLPALLESFFEARVIDLEAQDIKALNRLFPADVAKCPTIDDKEFSACLAPAAYDAWDNMYVMYSKLDALFRLLLRRVMDVPVDEWDSTRTISAEDKAAYTSEWPEVGHNLYGVIRTLSKMLRGLVTFMSGKEEDILSADALKDGIGNDISMCIDFAKELKNS